MRAYRKLASIALQQTVAYRSGFFLGLMGPAFFLLAMLYLWQTLLSNHTAFGMSWEEMQVSNPPCRRVVVECLDRIGGVVDYDRPIKLRNKTGVRMGDLVWSFSMR